MERLKEFALAVGGGSFSVNGVDVQKKAGTCCFPCLVSFEGGSRQRPQICSESECANQDVDEVFQNVELDHQKKMTFVLVIVTVIDECKKYLKL